MAAAWALALGERQENPFDRGQPPVQRLRTMLAGFLLQLPAKLPIGRRTLEDAPQQGLQVERRSAHEQHLATAALDLLDALPGGRHVLRQAVFLVRLDDVNQ